MKTKDFIKMLQEEDPSGEGYLRIGSGNPIYFMTQKEGYWDGPYSYLKKGEDGKPIWVQSTKGYKVDVYTIDMFDFSEKFAGDWDEVKKHIEVEYNYLDNDKHKNEFLLYAKKQCESYNKIKENVINDNWDFGISNEEWHQLSEYEKHLWLLDNDNEYEEDWNNAITRNINK